MYRYFFKDDWFNENFNSEEIDLAEEMVPYELIHALLEDIERLEQLVFEARSEANLFSAIGVLYECVNDGLGEGAYYDHPAMKRYIELYKEDAFIMWELEPY